jgi:hypothetical protein
MINEHAKRTEVIAMAGLSLSRAEYYEAVTVRWR